MKKSKGLKGIIVDLFAGGGGWSLGCKQAVGREPNIAINHNPEAVAMHARNHPSCEHLTQDVCEIAPRAATRGQKVWWLHASPDCRHFSRAKGAKPVEKKIRSLAWVVCRWAAEVKPSVISLENVREFEDWGPLVPRWECRSCKWRGTEGQVTLARARRRCPKCNSLKVRETLEQVPDPDRKGLTFKRFVGRLRNLGYVVAWKSLNAADFGAPTHRRRLFLIARRDGEPIVWPAPTHGDPKKIGDVPLFGEPLKPWRTAAECIDWSLPCPSIFDRKKPLAEATLKRIAMGIKRYVLDAAEPFIVRCAHGEGRWGQGTVDPKEPMPTCMASKDFAVVEPFVMPLTHHGERRAQGRDEPLPTVTGANRGEQAVVAPIISKYHGAFLAKHYGGFCENPAAPMDGPMGTVTACDHHSVVAANIVRMNHGEKQWNGADEPLPTVTSANHAGLVSAFMTKFRPGDANQSLEQPAPTVTANSYVKRPGGAAPIGIAAANLVRFNFDDAGVPIGEPLPTVTSNNHAALVYSFLCKYFGTAIGQPVDAPLGTATGKDRYGVILVDVAGEPYVIVDIGMRMLTPRELARAQGFPDDYELTGTKTSQVHKIGNSVSPPVARALVEANMASALADAV